MNTGAFGENFPYTNFHELNMDWIVKIAKDFLDQYTHIQDVISDGETSLEEKAEALENALQAWYDEHSADIANQLATAVSDFQTEAVRITNQVIASIPADYSSLAKNAIQTNNGIYTDNNMQDTQYADLDTLPYNEIVFYTASPAHRPTTQPINGYVLTINYKGNVLTNNESFTIQFCATCGSGIGAEQNTLYMRVKYSAWSNWIQISDGNTNISDITTYTIESLIHLYTDADITNTIFADMDTFPVNRIVYMSSNNVLHKPTFKGFVGYVLTFNNYGYIADDTNREFSVQMAFCCGSGTGTEQNTIYYRVKYANWSKWVRINGITDLNNDAIRGLTNYTLVGDSISVSISYPTIDHSVYVKSWGKILSDELDVNSDIYAVGGIDTAQMLASSMFTTAKTNANGNQYAMIELGINDINNSVSLETFETNYQSIVDQLLVNHKFVFCIGIANGLQSDRADYNDVIKSIASNTANAYYLDVDKYPTITGSIARYGHFSAIGYAIYTNMIKTLINELISTTSAFIDGNYDTDIRP